MMTRNALLSSMFLFVLSLLVSDSLAQITTNTPATDFAIFSSRDVTLGNSSNILGDIYAGENLIVNQAVGIGGSSSHRGDYYAGEDIRFLAGITDTFGNINANESIDFATDFGVDVTGNATFGTSISNNTPNIVQSGIFQIPNTVPSLSLPPSTNFSAGNNNVNTTAATVVLTPGTYGDIVVNSTTNDFHFQSGDYFIRSLTTPSILDLHFDVTAGPINIFATDDIFFESGLTTHLNGMEISQTSQVPPANIGLTSQVTLESSGDITLDGGFLNSFAGTLFAPQGSINVDSNTFFGSIIAGRNVEFDGNFNQIASDRISVPEPGGLTLLLVVGILAEVRRRRC